ncbi:hypothetical protein D3C86_1051600 [compost metagenome]
MTKPDASRYALVCLTIVTVLLAVVLVGFALGAALLYPQAVRYAQRMHQELATTRAETQELRRHLQALHASEERLSQEAAKRQLRLGRELDAQASQTLAQLATLEERRQRLGAEPGANPLAKLDTLIGLTRLLADELLLLNRHLLLSQHELAAGIRPSPAPSSKR